MRALLLTLSTLLFSCSSTRTSASGPDAISSADAPSSLGPNVDVQDTSDWIRPCDRGGLDYSAAYRALGEISGKVHRLGNDGDPEPVLREIEELLQNPCFHIAATSQLPLEAESALSLKDFWPREERFLRYTLLLSQPGGGQFVHQAPRLHPTLSQETSIGLRLQALLCPIANPTCDSRTTPWLSRARGRFRDDVELRWAHQRIDGNDCEEFVNPDDPQSFGRWLSCIDARVPRMASFPPGGIRLPESGWLLIRQDQLPYPRCLTEWIVDSETGWTGRTRRCSDKWPVDDPAARTMLEGLSLGRVSRDYLNEAIWMLLLVPELVQVAALSVSTPGGVERVIPPALPPMPTTEPLWNCGSVDTTSWNIDAEEGEWSGELNSCDLTLPTNLYPLELLNVALSSFALDCALEAPLSHPKGGTAGEAFRRLLSNASLCGKN